MSNTLLVVENLSKYFGENHAVDGVSLSVNSGEIVGFLGPNGAGKSTTIRAILGFSKQTAGKIHLFGEEVTADTSARLREKVSFVPAEVSLYENLSGQDHIDLVNGIRKQIGQKVSLKFTNELIETFDFNPSKRVRNLSTGNKQKLALILAFMTKPKLLILDEATTGLDPLLQNRVYDLLQNFVAGGTAVFMSSHILPEVEKVCERVYIIRKGKLVAEETIDSLKLKKIYSVRISTNAHKFSLSGESGFETAVVKKLNEKEVEVTISGSIKPLINALAKTEFKDIEINHSNLDDIFMQFYR